MEEAYPVSGSDVHLNERTGLFQTELFSAGPACVAEASARPAIEGAHPVNGLFYRNMEPVQAHIWERLMYRTMMQKDNWETLASYYWNNEWVYVEPQLTGRCSSSNCKYSRP